MYYKTYKYFLVSILRLLSPVELHIFILFYYKYL